LIALQHRYRIPVQVLLQAATLLSVAGLGGWSPGHAAVATAAESRSPAATWVAQNPAAKPSLKGKQGNYTANVFVAVPAKRAWSVLVNYEAMTGVMPDIKEAKVLRRNGPVLEVQQTYQAPYTFGRRIKAVLTMRESAPRQLSYELVRGDQIRQLRGTWTITPVAGGVLIKHQLLVDPEVPGFVRPMYFELMETNLVQSMTILKRLMEQS